MDHYNFSNIACALAIALLSIISCKAQLSATFYDTTCPNAPVIVQTTIQQAVDSEARMAASLIRLHFHDCFVQGCDASILLDQTSTIHSEQSAAPNANSVRGFEVIEAAKQSVESVCPGVVSCADILTLAARDASVAVGGPSWSVRLGRRDSTTANFDQANSDLPGPSSSAEGLISAFSDKGLSTRDMVALSGAHSIGRARCLFFRARIYSNGTDIDPEFAAIRQQTCPTTGGDSNLAPFDIVTPDALDNNYYSNLVQRRGLFDSDQILSTATLTSDIVTEYSTNPQTFANDFAAAMIRMSEIEPTLGQNGIIRRVCGAIN